MRQRIYENGGVNVGFAMPDRAGAVSPARGGDAGIDLLNTAIRTGFIVNEALAREHYQDGMADVESRIQEVTRQFEIWKDEYNRVNQGQLGVNALFDYGRKYDELAGKAMRGFEGSDVAVFRGALERKLMEGGLFALREGGAWGSRQREIWLESQYQSRLADFSAFVGANPEDVEAIEFKRQALVRSWREAHPGQDSGAMEASLQAAQFRQAMEGFMARGDTAAARRLYEGRLRLAQSGLTEKSALGDWAKAHNNPGNVTTNGRDMAQYATVEDGVMAIYDRFASYHKKGKKTVRDIIYTYAPPGENDSKAYVDYVRQKTGMAGDTVLDLDNPGQMAALAGAVLGMENGAGMDGDKLRDLATRYRREGAPRAIGSIPKDRKQRAALLAVPPDELRRYGQMLEAMEKADQVKKWRAEADDIISQIKNLPIDEREFKLDEMLNAMPLDKRDAMSALIQSHVKSRISLDRLANRFDDRKAFDNALANLGDDRQDAQMAMLHNMLAPMPDAARRDELRAYGLQRIKDFQDRILANDNRILDDIFKRHASQEDRLKAIQGTLELSDAGKARGLDLAAGPAARETLQNMRALRDGLLLADKGLLSDEPSREAYARQHQLTLGQTRELLDYAGNLDAVPLSRVQNVLKQLLNTGDFKAPDNIDMATYKAVLSRLPQGKTVTDSMLMDVLAAMFTSEDAMLFGSNLLESIQKNQLNPDWMPKVNDYETDDLDQLLQQAGLPQSPHNRQELKRLNLMKQMGLEAIPPQWEKN